MHPKTKENLKRFIGKIINHLPYEHKLVLSLYYFDNLTFEEISDVLEIPLDKVKYFYILGSTAPLSAMRLPVNWKLDS